MALPAFEDVFFEHMPALLTSMTTSDEMPSVMIAFVVSSQVLHCFSDGASSTV